jgi:hypothetical protein
MCRLVGHGPLDPRRTDRDCLRRSRRVRIIVDAIHNGTVAVCPRDDGTAAVEPGPGIEQRSTGRLHPRIIAGFFEFFRRPCRGDDRPDQQGHHRVRP